MNTERIWQLVLIVVVVFLLGLGATGLIMLPVHIASYRERGVLRRFAASGFPRWSFALAQLAMRVALGEDAGSIPVQRPYRYTLSVRIEPDAPWARIEPSVVRRADRVHRP